MVVEDGDGVEGVVEGERGRGRRRRPPALPLTLGAAVVWRPKDLRALLVVAIFCWPCLRYACLSQTKAWIDLNISIWMNISGCPAHEVLSGHAKTRYVLSPRICARSGRSQSPHKKKSPSRVVNACTALAKERKRAVAREQKTHTGQARFESPLLRERERERDRRSGGTNTQPREREREREEKEKERYDGHERGRRDERRAREALHGREGVEGWCVTFPLLFFPPLPSRLSPRGSLSLSRTPRGGLTRPFRAPRSRDRAPRLTRNALPPPLVRPCASSVSFSPSWRWRWREQSRTFFCGRTRSRAAVSWAEPRLPTFCFTAADTPRCTSCATSSSSASWAPSFGASSHR